MKLRTALFLFVVLAATAAYVAHNQPWIRASLEATQPPEEPLAEEEVPEEPVRQVAQSKTGMARFKDTGVYVDGVPVGVLSWGELPIELKPHWHREQISADKEFGDEQPGYTWVESRRYRFTDYLTAVGVDLKSIREIHVYGPKSSDVIIAPGSQLRGPKGQDFMFRFGGETFGKAIPAVPADFGNGKSPDKITAVAVYIKKRPPTLIRNQGLFLDGKFVDGIPYYGEPMRGGVRVYVEDRLAVVVKRKLLDDAASEHGGKWPLFELLQDQGVDTMKLEEGWVVSAQKRSRRLSAEQLAGARLLIPPQSKAMLLVGEEKLELSALTLHHGRHQPEDPDEPSQPLALQQ